VRAAAPTSTSTAAAPAVSTPAVSMSIPQVEAPLFPSPTFGLPEAGNLFVPSGYDQLDPLLFPGNAQQGVLDLGDAWNFDFTLQSFATQSHLPPPLAGEIAPDASFPPPDPFMTFGAGDNRSSSALVVYGHGASSLHPASQQRSSPGDGQKATEEWSPRRRKRSRSSVQKASKKSTPQPATPQSGSDPDAIYLQHYRTCICGSLTLKKDEQWTYNRYIYDLIRDSPRDCPFRLATLAWIAKHFASTMDRPDDDSWRTYYADAETGLVKLALQSEGDWTQPAGDESAGSMSEASTTATRKVFSAVEMTICTSLSKQLSVLFITPFGFSEEV